MRRSNLPITIITLAAFFAIAVYLGTYIYNALTNTLQTTTLEYVTIGDSYESSGVIIREEQLIAGGGGYVLITAGEGEKVAKNQQLAVRYSGSDALEVAAQLKDLRLRQQQIKAILDGGSTGEYALDSVLSLSATLRSGDLSGLNAELAGVDTYIFSGGYAYDQLQSEYGSLQSQIDTLESRISSGAEPVRAGRPGLFSAFTDGYESISFADVADITPSGCDTLLDAPQNLPSDVLGKLITGTTWYYVTAIPAEHAEKLTPGRQVRLGFSRTYGETLSMTVVSVSAEEDGRCAVIFSSNKYLSDLTQVREMYGEIMFDVVEGYSIPLEALHMDDNGTYVYIITNLQADQVYVDVQSVMRSGYIITETDGSKLYSGVEIITAANDLYDGKVVR